MPPVVAFDRCHLACFCLREILGCMQSAVGAQCRDDVFHDLAAIKRIGSVPSDQLQRLGLRGRREAAPGSEGFAVIQVMVPSRADQPLTEGGPVERRATVNGDTCLRVANGRGQHIAQRHCSSGRDESVKRIDRAGDCYPMRRVEGNRVEPFVPKSVCVERRRRPSRPIHRIVSSLGVVQQCEHIAAQTGHGRFAETQNECACNRCIDSVAATAQHVDRRQCGQRMRRRAHSVVGEDRRSSRPLIVMHDRCSAPREVVSRRAPGRLPEASSR